MATRCPTPAGPAPVRSDTLVFFGVTGDLAYKKIFPALQSLVRHSQLTVPVIGVAKAGWNVEQLRIDHYLGKVIPRLIIALVSLHLRLVLTAGINEYPQPGKLVRKETYVAEYASLVEAEGVPFVPKAIGKDLLFSALPMVGILVCSTVFGPSDPSGPPDPTQINTAPRKGRTPLELQGALMLQHKQCRNCHSLGGSGGKRGPALDGSPPGAPGNN